jgi:hypothetical protein
MGWNALMNKARKAAYVPRWRKRVEVLDQRPGEGSDCLPDQWEGVR